MVLKHLYSLIKYNTHDNLFTVSPNILRFGLLIYLFLNICNIFNIDSTTKTRKTTAISAYLSGLPMVLDRNFLLGNSILPIVLRLLRYLPLPSIDENVSIRASQLQAESTAPNYTIGLLNSQLRHSWISSMVIILYKAIN